jgi:hypothetical protein
MDFSKKTPSIRVGRCGGIGRRNGLKIRFPLGVRVQVPPSAPILKKFLTLLMIHA